LGNHKDELGRKIRMRRVEKGFNSQRELAEKMKIDQSRVSLWESGKVMPDVSYQESLIAILDLPKDFFIEKPLDNNADVQGLKLRIEKLEEQLSGSLGLSKEKSDLIALIRILPDRYVSTIFNSVRGLIERSTSDQNQSGT